MNGSESPGALGPSWVPPSTEPAARLSERFPKVVDGDETDAQRRHLSRGACSRGLFLPDRNSLVKAPWTCISMAKQFCCYPWGGVRGVRPGAGVLLDRGPS